MSLALLGYLMWQLQLHLLRRNDTAILEAVVASDGIWHLTLKSGVELSGELLPDSFVKPWLMVLGFRATEKKIYPISRPSSGNLWTIFNRKFLKLAQLRRTWRCQCRERQDAGSDVLRICSIKSPKYDPQGCGKCRFRQEHEPAHPNMNVIFGQIIFPAALKIGPLPINKRLILFPDSLDKETTRRLRVHLLSNRQLRQGQLPHR
jgi:hypothetical protein